MVISADQQDLQKWWMRFVQIKFVVYQLNHRLQTEHIDLIKAEWMKQVEHLYIYIHTKLHAHSLQSFRIEWKKKKCQKTNSRKSQNQSTSSFALLSKLQPHAIIHNLCVWFFSSRLYILFQCFCKCICTLLFCYRFLPVLLYFALLLFCL